MTPELAQIGLIVFSLITGICGIAAGLKYRFRGGHTFYRHRKKKEAPPVKPKAKYARS